MDRLEAMSVIVAVTDRAVFLPRPAAWECRSRPSAERFLN